MKMKAEATAKTAIGAMMASAVASKTKAGASTAAPATVVPGMTLAAGFQVICSGQIQSISYPGVDNLYCRYAVIYGTDWRVVHGVESGLSQLAYRSNQAEHDGSGGIVLNFPIDISFQSTNPFGWPRLVLSVYGLDALGRDVVRGYGSIHLPTTAGRHKRQIPLFKPLSSSLLQQFTAWLTGSPPEYFDAKFITQNDGREVTRVCSAGKVQLILNVATNGMQQYGYS